MFKHYLNLPRTVHLLCLGALVNRAGTFLVPFLTIYLQEELGLGAGFATRMMGLYGVGALIASGVGGHMADRIGRRIVMLFSLFGSAGFLMIFGSLTSEWSISAAILCFSFVAETYRPAASAMIADVTDPDRRPHAFGLMYVAINLGFAVAAAVGGKMASYSFQWLFWGDALTAALYGVLIVVMIRETLPARREEGTGSSEAPAEDRATTSGKPELGVVAAVKHLISDNTFMLCWFASFFLAIVYMQAMSTFPLYLRDLGFATETYGTVIALNGLLIVVLQLPVTSLLTRRHRGNMVILSAVLIAAGFGATGLAVTAWGFALTVLIWTCGEIVHAPLMSAIVSDLAPTQLRARYMGAYSMSFSMAMMLGAPIGGLVLTRFGGAALWGGCAAVGILSALLYAVVRTRVTPGGARARTAR